MSERVRARQSPLRDLMLSLHRSGIEVKFYAGRPGQPEADVFFVKMPEGKSMEDHVSVLQQISQALNESAEASPPQLLSYQSATSFIERMDELERDSNEHKRKVVLQEQESVDLQKSESGVFPCQEERNGRKKERQLNLLL
jgi:hypothetical protein